MAGTISRGELFAPHLQKELFNKIKGHSALAKLSGQEPIPFNGTKEFTFTFDKDVDIVAENGAKSNGGATLAPVTIVPIKVEYGARVSDEFMYGSEEEALSILTAWAEGFQKKVARALDIMAMHGLNPRTKQASLVIGDNHFDEIVTNEVTYGENDKPDDVLDAATQLVAGAEYAISGIALAPAFASDMSKMKSEGGVPLYPEFRFGQNPAYFAGMASDVNGTVSFNSGEDRAIVGDFQNAFKWGIAKEIPLKVIEYGNPDNDASAGDLQGHNQVYLRSEAYIGWGIMDKAAFAKVVVGE